MLLSKIRNSRYENYSKLQEENSLDFSKRGRLTVLKIFMWKTFFLGHSFSWLNTLSLNL